MEFAFIVDPLDSLKAYKDSSVAMMRALQARGHTLFALEPTELFWDDGGDAGARAPLEVTRRRPRLVPRRRAADPAARTRSPRC